MKNLEHEIDKLLCLLDASETDEWEGGLLCTPENRAIVIDWLSKFYKDINRTIISSEAAKDYADKMGWKK